MTTRWFVEVSPVDADTLKERYCVEALQWQQALQQARKIRGDKGALSRFAIELLDAGYRATDPGSRLRYVVSRAPQDAPLSGGTVTNGEASSPVAAPPAVADPLPIVSAPAPVVAPVPIASPAAVAASAPASSHAAVQSAAPSSVGKARFPRPSGQSGSFDAAWSEPARAPEPPASATASVVVSAPPSVAEPKATAVAVAPVAEAPAPPASADAPEPIPSLPGLDLISLRREEPSAASPIVYREYAFAVAAGLSAKDADRYVRAAWEQIRTALAHRPQGKFVQIALFDHRFSGRPERPPVAVLAWKDWRGDPVIQIRGAAPPASAPVAPATAPASSAHVAPAPSVGSPSSAAIRAGAPPPAAVSLAAPMSAMASASASSATAPVSVRAAVASVVVSAPPPTAPSASRRPKADAATPADAHVARVRSSFPPPGRRTSVRPPPDTVRRRTIDEDLIGELFEEMHQLHFMPDLVTGAEYVLNVLTRVMPTEGVLVHVFDINTRQFVVVRAAGPNRGAVLLHKTSDTFPLFRDAFRRARTLHFPATAGMAGYADGRWAALGVDVRSALCGPVKDGGRYLGILELANPAGGTPFHEGEVNAVDYICEQFAEFVASKPIVLDEDAVIPRT